MAPSAHYVATANSLTHTYKIDKVFDSESHIWGYAAYVDSTEWAFRSTNDIETCWANGARRAAFHNEVADHNDQSGGQTASSQDWTAVKYKNSSGTWVNMNEPLNIGCIYHDLSTQKCQISPVVHDAFRTWDSRYP